MPGDPRIRASDSDRDRVAALLQEHRAVGRLDADEFHERLDKAMAARTLGELDELLADLPAVDLYKLPDASLRRAGPGSGQSFLPADTSGPGPALDHMPTTRMAGLAIVAIAAAAFVVVGVATGVWFVPFWLVILIPVIIRRMSRRGR